MRRPAQRRGSQQTLLERTHEEIARADLVTIQPDRQAALFKRILEPKNPRLVHAVVAQEQIEALRHGHLRAACEWRLYVTPRLTSKRASPRMKRCTSKEEVALSARAVPRDRV